MYFITTHEGVKSNKYSLICLNKFLLKGEHLFSISKRSS